MLSRQALIDLVREALGRAGYYVSEQCDVRPVSFDIVARRDEHLLILKVLSNIDALGERVASEMKVLARFLKAEPVVVGAKNGAGPLEPGVVYERYGIAILHPQTFVDEILHDEPPLVYAAPGGYYVRMRGRDLSRIRRERNLSLGDLAKVAGVSRRTISMYEEGMSATVEAAMRLEEFLKAALIEPIPGPRSPRRETEEAAKPPDAVETTEGFEREVYVALRELGFEVVSTQRSPFDALTTERTTLILTSVPGEDGTAQRKARLVASLSRVTERPGVFFVRRRTSRTDIQGTAVVSREELAKVRGPEDIVQLILERGRKRAEPSS